MRRLGLTTNFVHVRGETRTNVYVVDEVGHVETGIAELGPYVSEDAIARFLANFQRMLRRASLVMLGGSLPPGVPQDFYRDLVRMTREAGIPTVIDAAGAPLMAALEAGPTVARIDHRFVSRLSGVSLNSLDNLIETVTRIHDQGVEWAVTSYRTYSHVFSTPGGVYLAEFERKGIASLFGAEDALIAGILVGRKEQMDAEQIIRFGVACAWEDALHLEKGVRGREAVQSLAARVRLEKLS
jgi:fructose-1-phosphate kinase PfkB-like protein